MDRDLVNGCFRARVSIRDGIELSREKGSITLSAAEAERLVQLLVSVMGVESYPVLPARLSTAPFEARFKPLRLIELHRAGEHSEAVGVVFRFAEGDDLIHLVRQAAAKFIDRTTIHGPTKPYAPLRVPDPPIDGR